MEVLYKSPGGKFTVKFEGGGDKEIFKSISKFQEIFESNGTHCGVDAIFSTRTVDGNDFYEKKCPKCGMKFSYGQHKVGGGLFPNSGKGWHNWQANESSDEDEQPKAPFAQSAGKDKGKGGRK